LKEIILWIGSSACLLQTHSAAAAALDLTDVNAFVGLGFMNLSGTSVKAHCKVAAYI
jgi:hypothetical protein